MRAGALLLLARGVHVGLVPCGSFPPSRCCGQGAGVLRGSVAKRCAQLPQPVPLLRQLLVVQNTHPQGPSDRTSFPTGGDAEGPPEE